jgi:excisionase family DNA binding protein
MMKTDAGIQELPKLWKEVEVARYFDVSVETVRRARRAGALPYTRIGRKIRYTEADIAAYLETQRCGSISSPVEKRASTRSAGPSPMDRQGEHQLALQIGRRPH